LPRIFQQEESKSYKKASLKGFSDEEIAKTLKTFKSKRANIMYKYKNEKYSPNPNLSITLLKKKILHLNVIKREIYSINELEIIYGKVMGNLRIYVVIYVLNLTSNVQPLVQS
jgi:hypothetical protein